MKHKESLGCFKMVYQAIGMHHLDIQSSLPCFVSATPTLKAVEHVLSGDSCIQSCLSMHVYVCLLNDGICSIIALGSNEYFELSYVDPITHETTTCTTDCTLSNDTTVGYQDFTVLNSPSATGIRIQIDSWYGQGGGLGGVEIFQSGKFSCTSCSPAFLMTHTTHLYRYCSSSTSRW